MTLNTTSVDYKSEVLFERLAPYRSSLFRFSKESLNCLSEESISLLYDYITAHKDKSEKALLKKSKPDFPKDSSDDISLLIFNVKTLLYIHKQGIHLSEQPKDLNSGLLYTIAGYIEHAVK